MKNSSSTEDKALLNKTVLVPTQFSQNPSSVFIVRGYFTMWRKSRDNHSRCSWMTRDKWLRRSGRDKSPLRSGDNQAGFNPEWQESKQMKRNNCTGRNNSQKMIAVDTVQLFQTFFAADHKPYLLISVAFGLIVMHNSYETVCHSVT